MARALSGATLRQYLPFPYPTLLSRPTRRHQLEGLIAGSHPRADRRDGFVQSFGGNNLSENLV